ncbi:MAG: zinc-dependent alcohol dehydrogenase family protein [Steroidobacteraceae bacterium]
MVATMRAMCLHAPGAALELVKRPPPTPAAGQVLIAVRACGVCRTDLHIVDGELPNARLPLVPGHEIVGTVAACGPGATRFEPGARIGVPWLGGSCGSCDACRRGQENLCTAARFTGFSLDGGYADFAVADERYCLPIPGNYTDSEAAPLLCAGLIGYRAYRAAAAERTLGLYGFGAAAHLLAQLACAQGLKVFAFTRDGDRPAQRLALQLGAEWTGSSMQSPPVALDAAIIFAPVGALVPPALAAVRPGGRVICAGIHMSDIPSFPYDLLWHEKQLQSVANLTRADGEAFMRLAGQITLRPSLTELPLEQANSALDDMRAGRLTGAAVLRTGNAA